MFKKLRLKLIFVNLAIITTLFLLLTVGAYFFSQNEMTHRAESLTRRVAFDINSGIIKDLPKHEKPIPGPRPFFVKTDPAGTITFASESNSMDTDSLAELSRQTQQTTAVSGVIVFGQKKYFYFKAPLDAQAGLLIVFHDFEHEQNMLHDLLLALGSIGAVCLLLSFFGSLFVANRAMIPIQKAWQQQKDFLADASHELRTPLTVIQTNLEVICQNQDATVASQYKWLNHISDELTNMTTLVDSLLFLARTDSQQHFIEKNRFYLGEALTKAVEPFQPVAAAKAIDLKLLLERQMMVCGDEAKLKQVIGIILNNALRHTLAEGSISLHISQSDDKAIIAITDTGEGMEAQHLDKIFDRFYQVDHSRSKGGAGLGLCIAKWIIESHGGMIQVDSKLGAGTTFTIYLPLEQGDNIN